MAANCEAPGIERGLISQCQHDDVLSTHDRHYMQLVVEREWSVNPTEVFQSKYG